jgi:hypothetical protein
MAELPFDVKLVHHAAVTFAPGGFLQFHLDLAAVFLQFLESIPNGGLIIAYIGEGEVVALLIRGSRKIIGKLYIQILAFSFDS